MSLQFNGNWPLKTVTHTEDYLHIPFHELSGSDVTINGRNGGVDFSSTFGLSGTTTNIWDNAGYITPSGDNRASLKGDSDISDILTPFGKKGMLLQLTVNVTRTGSDATDNTILKVNTLGGLGGYEIAILNGSNANANFKFFYAGEGTAGAPSLALNAPVDRLGEDVTFWVYMDFTRLWHSMTGTRANTADNVGWDTSSGTLFSSIDSAQDISLLSGHTSGPTPNDYCNNSLATVKVHDLRMWPYYEVPSIPSLYNVISEYGKYPYEDLIR